MKEELKKEIEKFLSEGGNASELIQEITLLARRIREERKEKLIQEITSEEAKKGFKVIISISRKNLQKSISLKKWEGIKEFYVEELNLTFNKLPVGVYREKSYYENSYSYFRVYKENGEMKLKYINYSEVKGYLAV